MTYSGLNKEDLREEIRKRRASLSTYEVLEKSNEIVARLKNLEEFERAGVIACYISFDNEVYTHGLIREFMEKKKILVPVVDENGGIFLSHLRRWEELQSGAYGILEPAKEFLRRASVENADIIIVPGIVFDERGNRIGYGGGYYDRLLSSTNALKVALAYEFQVLREIPAEEHDVRMDIIVTEERVLNYRSG